MAAPRNPVRPPVVDLNVLATGGAWVDAAPFRAHLRRLLFDSAEHWRVVALACGVAPATVRHLLAGRDGSPARRIRAKDAVLLLTTDPDRLRCLGSTPVPAADSVRRIAALRALGRSPAWIATQVRLGPADLVRLSDSSWCSALVELRAACACSTAGLSGWWSGDAWFDDDDRRDALDTGPCCARRMPDWAA
ncbi:MAG: hypothetical protein M0Z51_06430 [Propionibacterium sp.]|nr:hypothetical protein [Propionibacterium sp.]